MGRLLTILFIITVSLNVACNRGDANRENEVNGKYLKVNGHKLWVETLGKGEPLFLISGGDVSWWNAQLRWIKRFLYVSFHR